VRRRLRSSRSPDRGRGACLRILINRARTGEAVSFASQGRVENETKKMPPRICRIKSACGACGPPNMPSAAIAITKTHRTAAGPVARRLSARFLKCLGDSRWDSTVPALCSAYLTTRLRG
jgi:hypothetical protein